MPSTSDISSSSPDAVSPKRRAAFSLNKPTLTTEESQHLGVKQLQPFLTFAGAFILGASLVASNTLQPWSPAVVVVCYAIGLYVNRARIPLPGEIKDSAYYLGFSLNLAFLFVAFSRYGPQTITNEGAVTYLIEALGSAILATITGLLARYALYVVDDEELIQKQVFADLQEEIKKSVSGFRQSQRALTQTITAFVAARRELVSQEEEAGRKYLSSVAQLLTNLQALQDSHVKAITDSVNNMEPAAALSLRQLRTLNEQLSTLRQELTTAELARVFIDVKSSLTAVDSSAHGVRAKFDALSVGVGAATEKLSDMANDAPRVKSDLNAIDTILGDFIEILRQRVSTWEKQES